LVRVAKTLERAAYSSAARIVVLSDSFRENLLAKGVEVAKIKQIYNPATRPVRSQPRDRGRIDRRRVLTMGNVGLSQGLGAIVREFEANEALDRLGARFVIAGDGVAAPQVQEEIRSDRVTLTGVVSGERLEQELQQAAVAVVSQRYEGAEFNVPSKLMNFMGYGIPVVASVREDSEVARILRASGAGWVADSRHPEAFAAKLAEVLVQEDELERRGEAGREYALRHFKLERVADSFEALLESVVSGGRGECLTSPDVAPRTRLSAMRSPRWPS